MKLIVATGNEGKMKEIRMILADSGIEAVSLKEAGIEIEIEENGTTFEENALIKAKAVAGLSGLAAMADDSGLEVDYMDKAPGVFSARFLGEDTSYRIKTNISSTSLQKRKRKNGAPALSVRLRWYFQTAGA